MSFNLLHLMSPLLKSVPLIQPPPSPLTTVAKTRYTAIILLIYLSACQIPLFGVTKSQTSDSLDWIRSILASSRGTLMQLGISPIITAGWFMQILGFMRLFRTTNSTTQEILTYEAMEKVMALIVAFGEAVGQVVYGYYSGLSWAMQVGIILQLVVATAMIMYLDDVLGKGYGLGSGISLFIAVNCAENIFWDVFSPVTMKSEYGIEFQGSFVNLVYLLVTKPSKTMAVWIAFTRHSAPNLASLSGAIFIFFIMIYLRGFRCLVPLIYQPSRGYVYKLPVKLFYTSTFSIILQSLFVSHFYQVSSVLFNRFPGFFLVRWLGTWEGDRIVSGLIWWISPPGDLSNWVMHPVRAVVYTLFVAVSSAMFARFWLEIQRKTPRNVAKSMRDNELTMEDYKNQSVYEELNRLIPTATMLGGIVIGLLTILGDLLNSSASSTSLLLAVNTIYSFYDKLQVLRGQNLSIGWQYKP